MLFCIINFILALDKLFLAYLLIIFLEYRVNSLDLSIILKKIVIIKNLLFLANLCNLKSFLKMMNYFKQSVLYYIKIIKSLQMRKIELLV